MVKHKRDDYKNKEKLKEYLRRNKRKNYAKGREGCYSHTWTKDEDELVIKSSLTDREISKQIHHSVSAIQRRRWFLKKKGLNKDMNLNELLKILKNNLMIEEIRAYIYTNYIKIIDYTPGFTLEDGTEIEPSYGNALTIYYNENNEITVIEHNFNIFTPANKDIIPNIVNLIGTKIEDLDNYYKIASLEGEPYQTIK